MARRLIRFDLGESYHIYNRGNDKQPIFIETENYKFFLKKLISYLPKSTIEVMAYVLMPNHYHLLIRLVKPLDVSKTLKNFSISFVKAMNNRYAKVGHLFQGEFKAKHVNSTEYLLHLSRYIHMNPVFAKLVATPDKWKFSSYIDYFEPRTNTITNTDFILSHFRKAKEYREFVEIITGLDYDEIDKSL
ncbi:MAG: transposase [Ignavibacteriales bacterium]|nr:transposase [Ignavibacteriales bacterium]